MPLTPRKSILEITPYVGGLSKLDGQRVIKLSSNENNWGPSPKAIDAYNQAQAELCRYPDGGHHALRQAIADVYTLEKDRIVCGAGSDELISLLCLAYANAGDEVLYTEHGFLMYAIYARAVGAVPVSAKETNLTTDVDALLSSVTEKTKIIFIANPNNPTGSYISASEVARLRNNMPDHILLVLDGAYAEYVLEDDYDAGMALVESTNNTVMTRTFSKIYGLPALRLGWAYCPENIADILNRVRGPFNVTGTALACGEAAVRDVSYTASIRDKTHRERMKMHDALTALGLTVFPSVANFILVRLSDEPGKNATDVNNILKEAGILVRLVGSYGLPHDLRISIGTERENKSVIEAFTRILG